MTTQGNNPMISQEAEKSVLGCIVRRAERGEWNAVHAVSEDDFFVPEHRKLYKLLLSMSEKKQPVDLVTLTDEAEKADAGGLIAAAAVEAARNGLYYTNLEQYALILREASNRRKLDRLAEEIAKGARDPSEDIALLIDRLRGILRDMVHARGEWTNISSVLIDTYQELEKRQTGEIVGIKSGVADVDRATGGFFPGELVVVGARPSVGKSAFGLQIAVDAASHGKSVCFASCEMAPSQFGLRMFANTAKIDGMKLRNAKLEPDDWTKISDAMQEYAELPIAFTFGTKTVEDLRNDVQKKIDLKECDLLVIDYLQLLTTRRRFEAEHERVGYISHALKQMTIDFNIPIVALAQARRQNNNGRARCPVLDDLRASGDIEQDADTVIFLHRPDDAGDSSVPERDKRYFEELEDNGLQYIAFSVAKQRQGQTGIIGAVFDPSHMKYISMERIRGGEKA